MIALVPLLASVIATPLPSRTTGQRQSALSTKSHHRLSTPHVFEVTEGCATPQMRPEVWTRTFRAPAVDAAIKELQPKFKDRNLGQLFANTLPNALDSTVVHKQDSNILGGAYDTFIVTGDIDAMWQRDSTNQAKPYLRFLRQQRGNDTSLTDFFRGLIARQAHNTLLDPYANAFQRSPDQTESNSDVTTKLGHSTQGYLAAVEAGKAYAGEDIDAMVPGIYERKYELDSLVNVLNLAADYHIASRDVVPFDGQWIESVDTVLKVMVEQQKSSEEQAQQNENQWGPYNFGRKAEEPTDTLSHQTGWPAKRTGMVKTAFRASDDAAKFPFNIPENAFAVVALRKVANLLTVLGPHAPHGCTAEGTVQSCEFRTKALANRSLILADEIDAGIRKHGIIQRPGEESILAYEVDGHGNTYVMDDANIPSLLSLPYLGYLNETDPLYLATRRAILSDRNPWWFKGSAAEGIGGPHIGLDHIWPMALITQGWTATTDAEISQMLSTLVNSSACSGLIHESFNKNDFSDSTRPWFAWANSYFADFVLKVIDERPHLVLK